MASLQPSIQSKVEMIKEKMFENFDPYSFVCPSAYDTAWLAMIPDPHKPSQPMFKICLDWVLNNQHGEGFWGECDAFGKPTIESLPATLASIIALKKWNSGALVIEKGFAFIEANAEQLLKDLTNYCPRWFAIIFPAMVELAETVGLGIVFPETVETVSSIFSYRNIILQKEELFGKQGYPPLLSYLEALPPSYAVSEEDISTNLSDDGSLFQSPSATAKAFMDTKKPKCLTYLQSLVHRCPNGVPQSYPMDEDLIKLSIVSQFQRLGLAEKFTGEVEEIMETIYRNYLEQESWVKPTNMIEPQLQKDALAFQLLRMHGYKISPMSFCWFLHHQEIQAHIEKDYECFTLAMLNIYRASNLMFYGESELEEARSFSRKLLEKAIPTGKWNQPHEKFSRFHKLIEHELNLPWFARLDHLEHRMWIDEKEANALWKGNAAYNRISCYNNNELLQLAVQNYEFMQSIYKVELEELKRFKSANFYSSKSWVNILDSHCSKVPFAMHVLLSKSRWSENWGLTDMGFAREKTTYCYFAIAAATSLSHDSYVRMLVAKSAIIITVVDDFFDKEGTLSELEDLTEAIGRWDSRGLKGHSKVLFDALDALVSEAATKYLQQEGIDIKESLKDLWHETFISWLVEAKWARNGHTPSFDDYIKIGMISIALHTIVLPASCFLNPSLPNLKLRPAQYETITKLLMVTCRLLNDLQSYQGPGSLLLAREKHCMNEAARKSYLNSQVLPSVFLYFLQKEKEEGKMNSVFINLVENPESNIEDSISFVREIIDKKKKELLEHALIDGHCDLPKASKHLHLSCLKVFQMFFNSSNLYDSDTELLQDINKAIYLPVRRNSKLVTVESFLSGPKKNKVTPLSNFNLHFKQTSRKSFAADQISLPASRNGYGIVALAQKLVPSVI